MRRKLTYDPRRDYYTILGIDVSASTEEIRRAYRSRVRRVHPDLHPDRRDWATEQIQLINEAYSVLSKATARKEYDRLRWPHIPAQPAARPKPSFHGSFTTPDYDPDRPWWEQVVTHAPRGSAPAQEPDLYRPPYVAPSRWLKVSVWLRRHGLARWEPTWLMLVGLWRSPYAGLLSLLSVMLALNVAVIIYVVIAPGGSGSLAAMLRGWFPAEAEVATSTPPTPDPVTLTPVRLASSCAGSGVEIQQPVNYDAVADSFSIYGTVNPPDLWNYDLQMGYLGTEFSTEVMPTEWDPVRTPPPYQSLPEPPLVEVSLTGEPVDLAGRPVGYYVIRLRATLRSGETLLCDVIVQH